MFQWFCFNSQLILKTNVLILKFNYLLFKYTYYLMQEPVIKNTNLNVWKNVWRESMFNALTKPEFGLSV